MTMSAERGRVLHLRSSGAILGAENVIIEIAKNSPRHGWESVVGAINDVKDTYPDFLGLASRNGIRTANFKCHGRLDFSCIKEIKKFIEISDINIIHSHGYKEDIFTFLIPGSIPKIATNHLWKGITVKSKIYCYLDAMCVRFFDKIVGVSDEIVKQMEQLYIKNLYKIPNGIDINKYKPRAKSGKILKEFGLSADDIVLGMVSSLTYEKNHKMVIEALKEINLPNLKLLIVGDGKSRGIIQKQVAATGVQESIILAGARNDIVNILSVIDVFLMPSLNEGLPMALLEAMACGKAVIASRVGEIPNVVCHNGNGLLIAPYDSEQFVKAIIHLIEDTQKIQSFGMSARKTVEESYSSSIMAERYCEIYDSLQYGN